jgi:hypothetical protein
MTHHIILLIFRRD